ncbi:hypothetical protein BASA81_018108 [Batrachochytrium salamandrivorans]|nr:hypothetical protein BASA81_018108 [Batrachochytrium salamandrivorans]
MSGPKAQAEAMRKRNNFDENTSDYYFKVGDMVKMKHHDRQKLEFNWKGLTMLSMSLELENQALQQGIRPDSLREPKAALPDKFDGTRRHFRGFINQLELYAYDLIMVGFQSKNEGYLCGLSSEIKDHLVHCESPVSLAAAMDQAIRIDNRIFERRQEQQYNPRSLRRNPLPSQTIHRIHSQQHQHRFIDNPNHQQIHQPSAPITATPVQQRSTSNDMDYSICRRGPSNYHAERQQRFSQGLCLVCGQSGHLKVTCPRSTLALDLSDKSKPLKWKATALKFRETISADSKGWENPLTSAKHLNLLSLLIPPQLLLNSVRSTAVFLIPSRLNRCKPTFILLLKSPRFRMSVFLRISCPVFLPCFRKIRPETLPPHRDFDCSIDLKPGSEPFHGKIYQLTREEDKVMQEWIKDNLRKGLFGTAVLHMAHHCFFVKQKDKLRLCMDYRGLNKNTVKDRNPIPLISELLRTLSTGKIFTTLDLRGAYNLLRIKEGDESKTSFITKYGQFEFLVMPFGLANAPAQFQRMMNSLFRDVIGKHVLGLSR